MNAHPLVSIIIPAYNTESYIAKAIQSAQEQTLTNIEIIVIDDCSTDNTLAIAQSFNDPRITVVHNSENLGVASTRNKAIKLAKGSWLALLDSDDWYEPNRLETLLEVAQKTQAVLVSDDVYLIYDQAPSPWTTVIKMSGQTLAHPLVLEPISFITKQKFESKSLFVTMTKPIINRQFLLAHNLEYDPTLRQGQDYWFYLDCLLKEAKFIFYPYPYYYQRTRPGSLTQQKTSLRLESYCRANQKFLEKIEVKNSRELTRALVKNLRHLQRFKNYYKVVEPLKEGKFLEALQALNIDFLLLFLQRIPTLL
jgi:succinoglycan biosynthesis protein ExoO